MVKLSIKKLKLSLVIFLSVLLLKPLAIPFDFNAFAEGEIPEITAKNGAILMTADTGYVLYENNSDSKVPIASTTKILSTLIALEYKNLDEQFVVDSNAIKVEGSSMGLMKGDVVTMRDLCYGMILPSGNDAANAAAVKIAGSIDNFVKMMNDKASEIGMTSSHFETPSGLDKGKEHYSTAKDMALLTKEALKNDLFCEIASSSSKTLSYGNPPYKRTLYNHNKLLKMYSGACGVKTGFTDKAGRCLVSAAQRDGVKLICVVLFDPNDWKDSMNLLDYGFSKVHSTPIQDSFKNLRLPIIGGNKLYIDIKSDDIPCFAMNDEIKKNIDCKIKVDPIYYAPINKDEKIGEAEYLYNGKTISKVSLYSSDNIDLYQEKSSTVGAIGKLHKLLMNFNIFNNLN